MPPIRKGANLRKGSKRSSRPQRHRRLGTIAALLECAWNLTATGCHQNQWEIARHLVSAVTAVQRAQGTRAVKNSTRDERRGTH